MTTRMLAALLLCSGLVASCQGSQAAAAKNGPLRVGGEQGTVCTPLKSDSLTIGTEVLDNRGHGVRIKTVELLNAHGLKLVDAWIALLPPQHELVGLWPSFPPPSAQLRRLG